MLGLTAEQIGTVILGLSLGIIGLMGGHRGKQIAQGKGPPSQTDVVEVAGAIVHPRDVEKLLKALEGVTAGAALLAVAIDKDVEAKGKLTVALNRNSDVSQEMKDQIRDAENKMDRLREEMLVARMSHGGGVR